MNRQQSGTDIYHTMGDGEEQFFGQIFPGLHPNSHTSTTQQMYVISGGWESKHTFKYIVQLYDSIGTYISLVYHVYIHVFHKNCSGSVSFLDIFVQL